MSPTVPLRWLAFLSLCRPRGKFRIKEQGSKISFRISDGSGTKEAQERRFFLAPLRICTELLLSLTMSPSYTPASPPAAIGDVFRSRQKSHWQSREPQVAKTVRPTPSSNRESARTSPRSSAVPAPYEWAGIDRSFSE